MAELMGSENALNRLFLDSFPAEILDQICGYLTKFEISCVSRICRSTNSTLQVPLYRHIEIDSFKALTLLTRTLAQKKGGVRAQIAVLNIAFDRLRRSSTNSSQHPVPILVSRMIKLVSRHSPEVNISLCFLNSLCQFNSIKSFEKEVLPRVTKLVLFLGEFGGGHPPSSQRPCEPDPHFWFSFLNGTSYPDLKSIKIHHYWATIPPRAASLVDQAERCIYRSSSYYSTYIRSRRHRTLGLGSNGSESIGSYLGLEKLQEIYLESPPELDSALLMQILGNKESKASNLRRLELRFCDVGLATLSQLLQQELPTLKYFTLLLGNTEHDLYANHSQQQPSHHLCSLLRCFSKKLVQVKYAAPHVCRDLFFDENEINILRQSGVITNVGGYGVSQADLNPDRHAIRQSITEYRAKNVSKTCNDGIDETIICTNPNVVSVKSPSTRIAPKLLLEREEETRRRTIRDSKIPWKRSIICWKGLCHGTDSWAELQEGANMDEEGVEWILTNNHTQMATSHANGRPEIIIDVKEALEERPTA